jgi:hypothetical protein
VLFETEAPLPSPATQAFFEGRERGKMIDPSWCYKTALSLDMTVGILASSSFFIRKTRMPSWFMTKYRIAISIIVPSHNSRNRLSFRERGHVLNL